MTNQERKMLAHLNKFSTTGNFTDTEELYDDKFCSWDCENDLFVVEFKFRKVGYPTMLIEKHKYDACMKKSKETGKDFLYINRVPGKLIVWNLSKLPEPEWSLERGKHPATSAFANQNKTDKITGYLTVSDGFTDTRYSEVY